MAHKNYLIIGGTSGIGRKITTCLLEDGHSVNVISRGRKEPVDPHMNLKTYQADVTDPKNELPQIEQIIDGMVYCPGTINLKSFRSLKQEDFINDLNVNLHGAVRVIQHYLPQLQKSELASIILFSTVAVQTGMSFHASVAAAKGAVEGLGRSLAAEFAPKIRVNIIAPSLTNTPLAERLLNNDAKMEASAQRHPMKRIGEAVDISNLALFLLSEKSSWITGQVIKADGGISVIKS